MARYDLDETTLGTLLDDADVTAIFEKYAPGVADNPMVGAVKGMTATQAMSMAGAMVPAEALEQIRSEIEALN